MMLAVQAEVFGQRTAFPVNVAGDLAVSCYEGLPGLKCNCRARKGWQRRLALFESTSHWQWT